jgi:DEAD/DEAH box helicase domain-containing protein
VSHPQVASEVVWYCSAMSLRKEVVLDIETRNTFQDVGAYNPSLLEVSLVGVYFYETDTFESFLKEDLPKLWPRLERADRIIGYNLIGFDYPCLQTSYTGDMMKLPTVDLLIEIEKKLGFRIKLDDVAQATLGVGKSGHGLMAVEYWRKGEIDKLREYCLQDVRVTRDVYEHALNQGEVSYNDRKGQKQTIPLPIEPVQAVEKTAINLSLGL